MWSLFLVLCWNAMRFTVTFQPSLEGHSPNYKIKLTGISKVEDLEKHVRACYSLEEMVKWRFTCSTCSRRHNRVASNQTGGIQLSAKTFIHLPGWPLISNNALKPQAPIKLWSQLKEISLDAVPHIPLTALQNRYTKMVVGFLEFHYCLTFLSTINDICLHWSHKTTNKKSASPTMWPKWSDNLPEQHPDFLGANKTILKLGEPGRAREKGAQSKKSQTTF